MYINNHKHNTTIRYKWHHTMQILKETHGPKSCKFQQHVNVATDIQKINL